MDEELLLPKVLTHWKLIVIFILSIALTAVIFHSAGRQFESDVITSIVIANQTLNVRVQQASQLVVTRGNKALKDEFRRIGFPIPVEQESTDGQ